MGEKEILSILTPTFKSSTWSFNLCIKAKILLLSLQPKPSLGNLLSNIV